MSVKGNAVKRTTATKKETKKTITEEEKQALREMIARQSIAKEHAPVSYDTLSKPITYVTAGNGIFKVRKTPIGLFKRQIVEVKDETMGLPFMEEGVELSIPKLPFKYLMETLSFYRDVNTKDSTEASVLFFYNHNNLPMPEKPGLRVEGQIITYTPEQTNSKTLSSFKEDEFVHWLRDNTGLLLETHSH